MLLNILNDLPHCRTNLNLIIEQLRLTVVAWLSIIENMREEDDLKLIEVECLSDMQQ